MNDEKQVYILGNGAAPSWCAGLLTPYQKLDGSVGYEFYGWSMTFELCMGDRLIRKDGRIEIKRRGER